MEIFLSFIWNFFLLFVGVLIAHFAKAQIAIRQNASKFSWKVFTLENRDPLIANGVLALLLTVPLTFEALGIEGFLDSFGFAWAIALKTAIGFLIIPNFSSFFVSHVKLKEREV